MSHTSGEHESPGESASTSSGNGVPSNPVPDAESIEAAWKQAIGSHLEKRAQLAEAVKKSSGVSVASYYVASAEGIPNFGAGSSNGPISALKEEMAGASWADEDDERHVPSEQDNNGHGDAGPKSS